MIITNQYVSVFKSGRDTVMQVFSRWSVKMSNTNTVLCLVCTVAAIFATQCYAADPAAETVLSKAQEMPSHRAGEYPNWDAAFMAGQIARQQGNKAEAEKQFSKAVEIAEKSGPSDDRLAVTLNNLSQLEMVDRKHDQAIDHAKKGLEITERTLGKDHMMTAIALDTLAGVYSYEHDYTRAEPIAKRSLALKERIFGKNDPRLASTLSILISMYKAERRNEEAAPLEARMRLIGPHLTQ
jgi:tetratricopeptide (TPR) repeat protein